VFESVERDYLKNILHKLYAKLVPRRKMIRKAINECFFALIHENHKFNGAAELLDILASIISGFAVPLRDEHVIFFQNIIIPLHKVQTCSQFYEQLLRCSMLFLTKDRTLAIPLLEGLLKFWPFANCIKETLFLTELQEVLEVCEVDKVEHLTILLNNLGIKCSTLSTSQTSRTSCSSVKKRVSFMQLANGQNLSSPSNKGMAKVLSLVKKSMEHLKSCS
jgi:serine/threonine-protein phosphatase 2A regulatory subunit B'